MRKVAFWLSLAFVFTIPWEVVVEHPLLGSASRMAGLALAAFWIVAVLVTGRFRTPAPLHLAVFLFVAWNGLSTFWSADVARTLEHTVTWLQLLVLFCIVWDLYTSPSALLTGLQMYILGAYVVAGNALINYFAGNTYYWERFSATGTNPDDLGAVLALGLPVAWYLIANRSAGRISWLLKWVNYAYIPAALFGIALSGTRTALIAAVPGFVFGLASLSRLKLWTRIVIFVLVIMAATFLLPLVPQASLERLGTTGTELAAGDFTGRARLWREGLTSVVDHPLVGVGSNMYRSVNTEGKVAHNSYLSVLVELGMIGIVLFGSILVAVIRQAFRQPRFDKYFWLAVLAGWAITAFTLTWEYTKPTWLFFSLVVASSAVKRGHVETAPAVPGGKPNPQFISSAAGPAVPGLEG